MRVTEQILVVTDYGDEREEVMACCDNVEEARLYASAFTKSGPVTLCRVRIIEVVEVVQP